jgi:hypothetical protein
VYKKDPKMCSKLERPKGLKLSLIGPGGRGEVTCLSRRPQNHVIT